MRSKWPVKHTLARVGLTTLAEIQGGGNMSCCIEFDQALRDRMIIYSAPQEVTDGPFMNEIMSEYFLVKVRDGGHSYYAINYCPFCGKPRSASQQGFLG